MQYWINMKYFIIHIIPELQKKRYSSLNHFPQKKYVFVFNSGVYFTYKKIYYEICVSESIIFPISPRNFDMIYIL